MGVEPATLRSLTQRSNLLMQMLIIVIMKHERTRIDLTLFVFLA